MFSSLKKIIEDVNEASDLQQALNIAVHDIREVMQADAVSVYFRDDKADQLVLMATDGLKQTAIGKIRFSLNQGLVGLVLNLAEPVNIEDAHGHPNYRFVTETGELSFHGFLGVPVIQHRHVLGVLVVRQTRRRRFSANEEAFLVTLAAQLAGSISYAKKMGELNNLLADDIDTYSFHMKGLVGSPGIAIARAQVVFPPASLEAVPDNAITADEIDGQISAFNDAINSVEVEFRELSKRMEGVIPNEELALFDVFALMLKSESLIEATINRIKAGQWAQAALRETIAEHVRQFEAMPDDYLRERAVDIKDLGRRILTHLQERQTVARKLTGPVVLAGEEVTVSQFAEVPVRQLAGIISTRGSAASHVAILCHAMGIPSVMGLEDLPVNKIKGQQVVVDGYGGQIYVKPSPEILQEFRRLLDEEQALDIELRELVNEPCETLDGIHIPLYVNTGLQADVSASLKSGAEGVGLYRTEIPFLMADGFPGEKEQSKMYRQILQGFAPRPVTFRTLDIGGDKSLPYFPVAEENPFLGWRGIRIMLDHPEIFVTQIRAILKANIYDNNLRLMLPMITDVSEVDEAIALIKKAHAELLGEGVEVPFPEIGLMIEVPSAVSQMKALAKRADFFSIGSNDLTQYLLAVDRNNKRVSELYNSMHPSVLHAIRQVVSIAHKHNKAVSVCGEMAGNPVSALALAGIGVDILSMSVGSLLRVKLAIRSVSHKQMVKLATRALAMESADAIRLLFNNALEKAGAGRLVKVRQGSDYSTGAETLK